MNKGNGNILAGAVGAFLFALIGGVLYFVVYQIGFIAGICGLVIFILANFGSGLFAKSAKNSIAGLIASIVSMLIVIFAAEYFCLSYENFQAYKELDITFFEAVRATPDFLAEPEVQSAVIEELVIAYALGILASVGNIINIVKARKAAAQEENQVVE